MRKDIDGSALFLSIFVIIMFMVITVSWCVGSPSTADLAEYTTISFIDLDNQGFVDGDLVRVSFVSGCQRNNEGLKGIVLYGDGLSTFDYQTSANTEDAHSYVVRFNSSRPWVRVATNCPGSDFYKNNVVIKKEDSEGVKLASLFAGLLSGVAFVGAVGYRWL
jgi:hypothetical protein